MRLQLELTKKAARTLKAIKKAAGTDSNAQTIGNALRLYEFYLDHQKKGTRLQILEKGSEDFKELEIVFDP